jgi:Flp pilus assembly protein TadD
MVEAHFNRGLAFHGLSRFSEAVENYRQALSLNPGYAPAYTNLMFALLSLGDKEAAKNAAVEAESRGIIVPQEILDLLSKP